MDMGSKHKLRGTIQCGMELAPFSEVPTFGGAILNTVSLDGFREAALREGIPFTALQCGQGWEVRTAQSPNQL